jgi:homeobox protein cut-like
LGYSFCSCELLLTLLLPRFRAKVIELEEELGRVKQELATAKSEAAAAKADNVALVERLR